MRTDTKEGEAFSRAGAVSKASGSRSSDSAVRWHAGSLNNGLIFGLTYHLVTRLPRAGSYAIGHAGTWLAYHLMREGTRAVVGNLRVVRPDATERELK